MHKQKCSILVTSPTGEAWTTPRGSRRLIARGVARFVNAKTIEMVMGDHRVNCEARGAHGAALEVQPYRSGLKILIPHGFLPYPHRTQTTSGVLSLAAA